MVPNSTKTRQNPYLFLTPVLIHAIVETRNTESCAAYKWTSRNVPSAYPPLKMTAAPNVRVIANYNDITVAGC